MKYVILAPRPAVRDMDRVIAFTAPTVHREVAEKWAATHAPVSAGYFQMLPGGAVRTFGRSDSLGLAPREGDAELISSFERGTNAMAIEADILIRAMQTMPKNSAV